MNFIASAKRKFKYLDRVFRKPSILYYCSKIDKYAKNLNNSISEKTEVYEKILDTAITKIKLSARSINMVKRL